MNSRYIKTVLVYALKVLALVHIVPVIFFLVWIWVMHREGEVYWSEWWVPYVGGWMYQSVAWFVISGFEFVYFRIKWEVDFKNGRVWVIKREDDTEPYWRGGQWKWTSSKYRAKKFKHDCWNKDLKESRISGEHSVYLELVN